MPNPPCTKQAVDHLFLCSCRVDADARRSGSDRNHEPFEMSHPPRIVTVRPDADTITRQRLPYFIGISGPTAGATGLSLSLVVIPPGARSEPHLHRGYETAIYVLKGRVETRYGPGLRESVVNEAGDFLFIPANLLHQAINLSDCEPAHAIVARNDPNEAENVVLHEAGGDA